MVFMPDWSLPIKFLLNRADWVSEAIRSAQCIVDHQFRKCSKFSSAPLPQIFWEFLESEDIFEISASNAPEKSCGAKLFDKICKKGPPYCGTWRVLPEGMSQMFRLLYLVNGWADCVEIWHVLGDPLVTAYAVVTGGVSLHVRTCRDTPTPRFCISETAWPIVFKFGMWVEGR